jgi:riboflavin synthase alpha subunit
MFTGIIEELGEVKAIEQQAGCHPTNHRSQEGAQ